MLTPETRAHRATVQHHSAVPPIRPAGAGAIPFATRLSWAAQALTAAHLEGRAGDPVSAGVREAIAKDHLAALRAQASAAELGTRA